MAWWTAYHPAGPGWIIPGLLKLLAGSFLAYLAIRHLVPVDKATEPTQMYLVAFGNVFSSPQVALAFTCTFVIISQIKINVTNAYAGSIAWSNFFSRLTHSHPGRVVWLVFNVAIALLLMELGVFKALEHILGLYSLVAVAWVGALVAGLVVNKPLGLSPPFIGFKRAHLFDVNPVGGGAMLANPTRESPGKSAPSSTAPCRPGRSNCSIRCQSVCRGAVAVCLHHRIGAHIRLLPGFVRVGSAKADPAFDLVDGVLHPRHH